MKKVLQMTRTALTVLVTAGLMTAVGYPSSQLGDDTKMITSLRAGTLEMF